MLTPANENDSPVDRIIKLDEEIGVVCEQLRVCQSLPPKMYALATTRLHYTMKLLEEARWTLAQAAFPEATKSVTAGTFEMQDLVP